MKTIFKNILIATMIISSGLFSQVDPYVINSFDTAEQATDEGTDAFWTEYDETDETMNFSTLSHIDASQAPENDTPVMDYSYGVVGTFGWGGYTGELKIYDQVVDLSDYNYLSFKVYNMTQPQNDGVTVRVCLFDVSDATSWSSRDDLEVWYSFFENDESFLYNTSEDGWSEYRIPLQASGTNAGGTSYTQGFTKTGWAGIGGNDAFDKDKIGGLAIEIVSTVSGETVSGEFLIEDLQAIYSADISGCMDQNACNYNAEATMDDGTCYDCVAVTYNLDMSSVDGYTQEDQPYLAGGSFFGVPGNENNALAYNEALSVDGALIFSNTVQMAENTSFDYTYTRDDNTNWSTKEAIAGQDCAVDPYSDRRIITTSADTTVNACFSNCTDNSFCDLSGLVDVTFSVNMQEEDTNPEGVWIAGGSAGNPGFMMNDADGDDVWTLEISLVPEVSYTYKFVNGPIDADWGGAWEDVPADCGVGEYLDREFSVGSEDVIVPTVCFGGCADCLGEYSVDITFNLDMSNVDGFDGSDMPYIFGSYNNWDNFTTQTMLSDDDGDNVYTGTILDFSSTDSVTVLFGFGQTIESVPGECSILDNDLTMNVRQLPIMDAEGDSVLVLDAVSFGDCPMDDTPSALFQVDVSSVINLWPADFELCVTGSADNWSGCGTELTDEDGDNIYTAVVHDLMDATAYEYKFLVNAGWGDVNTESGAPLGSACDFDPSDEFNNYGFVASEGPMLDLGIHPWNECPQQLSNDDTFSKIIPDNFSYKAYPNPFNPFVNLDYALPSQEMVNLSIVNLLGQKVKTLVNNIQEPGNYSYKWDGKDMNGVNLQSGIYFAVISHKSGSDIIKLTYLK